jgi:arginase family enzyme
VRARCRRGSTTRTSPARPAARRDCSRTRRFELRRAALLGLPSAIGSRRPDAAAEPARLRRDGLLERLRDLELEPADLGDVAGLDPPWQAPPPGMRLANLVPALDQLRRMRGATHAALLEHGPPLIGLGGDGLVALGLLAGIRDALGDDPGLLWIGPFAPLETRETTRSGELAGMVLAAACGVGAEPLLDAVEAPLVAPPRVALAGLELAAGREQAARLGVRVAAAVSDLDVPEGPLLAVVDARCLADGGLGVDAARQLLLAAAVGSTVAGICLVETAPGLAGPVQVAALVAAALR